MIATIIIAAIAGASLGVTLIVLLIRGTFQLGKLVNKVDNQETRIDNLVTKVDDLEAKFNARFDGMEAKFNAKFDSMEAESNAKFDALTTAINGLRLEVQQTNRVLVGLANHTHDADGLTVFTIPS